MTISISVGHGKYTIIDDIDADLKEFNWHLLSGKYVARRLSVKEGRKYVYLHQIIFERKYGHKSNDQIVADHKDLDIYNNTRDNIRIATKVESGRNRRGYAKSGLKGAYPVNGKWKSSIGINGKTIYLGLFNTPQKAHEAYAQATKDYEFGDFANLEHQTTSPICEKCQGLGHTTVQNGDDDVPCDQCQLDDNTSSTPY